MIACPGPVDNADELIQFVRRELPALRHLRKLVVTREKTEIVDVNGDVMEFAGLTYGNPVLDRLLQELGVVFNAQVLHDPNATPGGIKEYRLSARWTWGHDRVM